MILTKLASLSIVLLLFVANGRDEVSAQSQVFPEMTDSQVCNLSYLGFQLALMSLTDCHPNGDSRYHQLHTLSLSSHMLESLQSMSFDSLSYVDCYWNHVVPAHSDDAESLDEWKYNYYIQYILCFR